MIREIEASYDAGFHKGQTTQHDIDKAEAENERRLHMVLGGLLAAIALCVLVFGMR